MKVLIVELKIRLWTFLSLVRDDKAAVVEVVYVLA